MNADIKQRWVAALRSGEYKQGRHSLRTADNAFCCLGVLCDIAVGEGVVSVRLNESQHEYLYDARSIDLPDTVTEWAGMSADGEDVTIQGKAAWLGTHNDEGRTFTQIADAIEAQL